MDVTPFGRYLRALRIKHGITLFDMAKALDLGSAQLCAIELGNRSITNDIANKIAHHYKIDNIDELNKLIAISQPKKNNNLTHINENKECRTFISQISEGYTTDTY